MENSEDPWEDIISVLVDDPAVPLGRLNGIDCFDQSALHEGFDFLGNHKSTSSKKRKANPDADDIAKATEETLNQLGLDPNSEEFKLKKRQIRNRISAQSHRDRKNGHIQTLEQEIAVKNSIIADLQKELCAVKMENEALRYQLQRFPHERSSSIISVQSGTASSRSQSIVDSSPSDSPHVGSQSPDYSLSSNTNSATSSSPHITTISAAGPGAFAANPLVKSLSFLCVVCVLCLCDWSSMSGVQQDMSGDHLVTNRRRLLEVADVTEFVTPPTTLLLNSTSLQPTVSVAKAKAVNLRRREPVSNDSHNSLTNLPRLVSSMHNGASSMQYLSRDLIPFPITKGVQEDWFSYQQRIQALSSSQIFLQSGFALFDPAFSASSFGSHEAAAALSRVQSAGLVPSTTTRTPVDRLNYRTLPALLPPADHTDGAAEAQNSAGRAKDSETKRWPAAVTTRVLSLPVIKALEEVTSKHLVTRFSAQPHDGAGEGADASVRETPLSTEDYPEHTPKQNAAAAAATLVSESNIVTVTLPATAIKLGHNLQESEQGTVDSILRMFNLTQQASTLQQTKAFTPGTSSNVNQTESGALPSMQNAWVEMSCIVVGAKIMWNMPV